MNILPIGIIGCGYIANKAFLPVITTLPAVKINMVLSQTTKNWDLVKSSLPKTRTTTNLDIFLLSGIKAAFVLTHVDSHYALCDRLLDEGIHVFVEKPPTTSAHKTLLLAQKAQNKNLVFMVGFNRRYSTPIQKALEIIREHEIRLCIFEKHRPSLQERGLAETYQEDLIHQIDLLRMFCGELTPLETSAIQMDGNLLSSISTATTKTHGMGVILHSRESGRWQERVTIIGNEKTILIDLFKSVDEINATEKKRIWEAKSGKKWLDDRGFREEIIHFIDCIRTPATPLTTGFEAAKTQEFQEHLVCLYNS